jgi:hypothetical protein
MLFLDVPTQRIRHLATQLKKNSFVPLTWKIRAASFSDVEISIREEIRALPDPRQARQRMNGLLKTAKVLDLLFPSWEDRCLFEADRDRIQDLYAECNGDLEARNVLVY